MSEPSNQLDAKKVLLLCGILVLAWGVNHFFGPFNVEPGPADEEIVAVDEPEGAGTPSSAERPDPARPPAGGGGTATAPHPGDAVIEDAIRRKRTDFQVEVRGEVFRLLADDDEGSRHQKLLIRLGSKRTLLIVHNIDLAPRVPAKVGDALDVAGEYIWNDRGGLVHWTHHDPRGRHPGGWIEHRGKRYE